MARLTEVQRDQAVAMIIQGQRTANHKLPIESGRWDGTDFSEYKCAIEWPNVNGHRVTSQVYGYYFELDWGIQHQRIPSLMYIQMYDPYNIADLAPKGYVKVTAAGAFHGCVLKYDFTRERLRKSSNEEKAKKHYRIQHKPLYRVYGQDEPFL